MKTSSLNHRVFCKSNRVPLFICFTGIDGAGKSTYAQRTVQELQKKGYKAKYVWMRMNYMLARPLLFYCRLAGLTRRPMVRGKRVSIHEFQRSPMICFWIRFLHTVDTLIVYFFKILLPMKVGRRCVVCDRFVYDILVDYMIESGNYQLYKKAVAKVLTRMVPNNSILFFIDTQIQNIIKRRPVVLDFDVHFFRRYQLYLELADLYDFKVIDNNRDPELVFQEIEETLQVYLR